MKKNNQTVRKMEKPTANVEFDSILCFKMRMKSKCSPLRLNVGNRSIAQLQKVEEMKQIPFFQFVTIQRFFQVFLVFVVQTMCIQICVHERRDFFSSFFFHFLLLFCWLNSCNDCVASATRTNIALDVLFILSLSVNTVAGGFFPFNFLYSSEFQPMCVLRKMVLGRRKILANKWKKVEQKDRNGGQAKAKLRCCVSVFLCVFFAFLDALRSTPYV